MLKNIFCQDLLPQEQCLCELMVRVEAYLLACVRRQLRAFDKDADGFQGE
jgi:hypothetical protein